MSRARGANGNGGNGGGKQVPTPQGRIEALLTSVADIIERVAPHGSDPDRMKGQFIHVCMTVNGLLECDEGTLQIAAIDVATQGLEIGEEIYIIPRNVNRGTRQQPRWSKEAVVQIGYKGLLKKLYRSRHVSIARCAVYRERDQRIVIDKGSGKVLHEPCMSGHPGEALGYWCSVELKDGRTLVEYMTREQIEEHCETYGAGGKAWNTSFDAMALKTVIIQTLRTAPKEREISDLLDMEYGRDRRSLRELGLPSKARTFEQNVDTTDDEPDRRALPEGRAPEPVNAPIDADLSTEPAQTRRQSSGARSRSNGADRGDLPTHLPPFGQCKGEAIASTDTDQLRWYGNVAHKNSQDPEKSRFKAENEALVAAIHAELDARGE